MKQKLLQQKLFFLLIGVLMSFSPTLYGQTINYSDACGFNQTLSLFGTDATGRNEYRAQIDPGPPPEFQIVKWNTSLNRWEIYVDNFSGNPGTFVLYGYNTFASTPNPPDNSTGTWTPTPGFSFCWTNGSGLSFTGPGTQNVLNACTDAAPPTITCPADQNRNLDGSCIYTIEDFTGLATNVTDDCTANPTVTQSPASGGSITMAGTTQVTLTATDDAGNMTNCNFDLIVEDDVSPTVTCPTIDFNATVTVLIIRAGGTPGDVFFNITDAGNNVVASEAQTSSFGFSSFAYNLPCDANYTFNYTDNSGGLTQNVQVQVNNTPVITLAPITTGAYPFTIDPCNVSTPGQCAVVLNGLAPTVMDNCATTTTYTLSGATTGSGNTDASGQSFNVGTTTLMYTATDGAGNSGNCSVDITIGDGQDPVANCPSNITQNNAAGQCGANVTFTIPDPTDNCPDVTSAANPASGSFFAVGTTQVTLTATDNAGNTSTCNFDVTINDTEDPTANCPATQTVDNTAGQCGANVSFTIPNPTDNCSATSAANPASGSLFNVGTTQVTVTATDAAGNTGTCTFDVVVNDTEDPTANCPATHTVGNTAGQCGANVNFTIPNPTDNCLGATSAANPASGSFFDVGTTQVTVTATDAAGNTGTCTFDVVVNDTEDPTIVCPEDVSVNAAANECSAAVSYPDPTVSDNCPNAGFVCNPAAGSTFNVGNNQIVCTATDGAGNTSQCIFTVTVNDVTAPSATCPDNITVSNNPGQCGANVPYSAPTASDACGIAAEGGIVCSPASSSFFDVGTTAVNCTIMDVNGNSSSCSFNVTVNDTENPTPVCPGNITRSNDAGSCGAIVSYSTGGTDNCPGVSGSTNPASGSFFNVGTTQVTVMATDAAGNQDQCTFDVTVNDTEVPNMVCNDFNLTLTGSSTSITSAQMDGGSTDNCGITSFQVVPSTLNCSTIGAQTVTLTGTDAAGNSSSCTGTVTVIDNNPPTASCQDFTANVIPYGPMAFISTGDIDNNSSSVCNSVTLALDVTNFTCSEVGDHTVTLTVTDTGNGLTSTCTATVTVEDPNSLCCAPANAVCNNTTVQLDANGMGSIMPSDVGGGSTADCGLQSENVSPQNFDCNDVGNPVSVTYTITDINGASSSCNATVTVEDNIAPTAGCTNVTVQLDANGDGSTTAAAVESGSTDNCGTINTVSLVPNTFTCGDIGPNTVTLTINDGNGNTSTCTATATVEDNTPPMPVCSTSTVEIQPDGTYTLQEADVYDANSSTDNCSIDNVSFPATTYDCDDEDQTFTVPVTVTDAGGNTASCNATITVTVGDALPNGWQSNDIGAVTVGNDYSFDPCATPNPEDGFFTVGGSGNNAFPGTTDDAVAYAYQTLCGNDITITAKVETVTPDGYGGLMIRETGDADSKQVAIFSNLSNSLRHETRYFSGANKVVQNFVKPSPVWLRLQRQGNWVFAFYSTNGMFFQYVHAVYIPLNNCIQIGLASFTYLPNTQTEATFSNVEITGGTMPNVVVPEITEAATIKQAPSLYPNPANNMVNLVFENGLDKDAIVTLRNQLGQVIEQRELRAGDFATEWNVSTLVDGLYLFEIRQDGEEVQVLRLVKTQ
ncbi:MAG: HYR domain-containing protein [Chitinophagales bacterium]|nr:HYR domain-containing protein [Chitinophagales bacterium]